MHRRHFCRATGLVLTSPALLQVAARAADSRSFSFGVVPQQSATELAKAWIPLFNTLAEAAGFGLRFATAPNIPVFEKRLAAGEYDFAYMNPYHYTVFSQKPGYRAFAREKGRRLRGMVVVRKDHNQQAVAVVVTHRVVAML